MLLQKDSLSYYQFKYILKYFIDIKYYLKDYMLMYFDNQNLLPDLLRFKVILIE